jgi:hypothetical protein
MNTEILISHNTPLVKVESTSYAIDVSNPSEIVIERAPSVVTIDYQVIKGADGLPGEAPDLSDASNIDLILAGLSGQITSTQLHSDLTSEIDKISLGSNSISAQLALLEVADNLLNQSLGEAGLAISEAKDAATLLKQRVDVLAIDYSDLDGDLEAQVIALGLVTGRVTTAEGGLLSQAEDFRALATSVGNAEDEVAAQALIIDDHTVAINALTGSGGGIDLSAMADDITRLQADVGDNSADIAVEQSVRASVVGVSWTDLATYSPGMTVVYASNLYRSLTTNTNKDPVTNASDWTAISGTVYSQYSVKLDSNGKVAGFGLMNDGAASAFEIVADRFSICNTSGAGTKFPFIVDSTYGVVMDVALIKDLTAANISVDSISADRIKTNELIVGTNITMGANAYISWDNVSTKPADSSIYNSFLSTDIANAALTANWGSVADKPTTLAALDNAAATQLDKKSVTYYQTSAPTGLAAADTGDIWFDTDDSFKMYSWTGSAWQAVQDSAAASALATAASTAAGTAQSTANSKITTFYSTSTPTALGAGDLWYNSTTKILKRWDGSSWVDTANNVTNTSELTDGAGLGTTASWANIASKPADSSIYNSYVTPAGIGAIKTDASNAPTSVLNSTITIDATTGVLSGIGTSSVVVANPSATSQATTPPSSPKKGDIWFNAATANGTYKARTGYTYSGSAWVQTSPTGTYLDANGLYTQSATIGDLTVTEAKIAIAAVTNAKIGNLAVDTLQIANNAVTIPVAATVSSYTVGSSYGNVVSASANFTGAGKVFIQVSFRYARSAVYYSESQETAPGLTIAIYKDNTSLYNTIIKQGEIVPTGVISMIGDDFVTIGYTDSSGSSCTYYLKAAQNHTYGGGVVLSNISMFVLGVKK